MFKPKLFAGQSGKHSCTDYGETHCVAGLKQKDDILVEHIKSLGIRDLINVLTISPSCTSVSFPNNNRK